MGEGEAGWGLTIDTTKKKSAPTKKMEKAEETTEAGPGMAIGKAMSKDRPIKEQVLAEEKAKKGRMTAPIEKARKTGFYEKQ